MNKSYEKLLNKLDQTTNNYNLLIVSKIMADIICEKTITNQFFTVQGENIFAYIDVSKFDDFPSSVEEVFNLFVQCLENSNKLFNNVNSRLGIDSPLKVVKMFTDSNNRQKYIDSISNCIVENIDLLDHLSISKQMKKHNYIRQMIVDEVCKKYKVSSDLVDASSINRYMQYFVFRIYYQYNVEENIDNIFTDLNHVMDLNEKALRKIIRLKPSVIEPLSLFEEHTNVEHLLDSEKNNHKEIVIKSMILADILNKYESIDIFLDINDDVVTSKLFEYEIDLYPISLEDALKRFLYSLQNIFDNQPDILKKNKLNKLRIKIDYQNLINEICDNFDSILQQVEEVHFYKVDVYISAQLDDAIISNNFIDALAKEVCKKYDIKQSSIDYSVIQNYFMILKVKSYYDFNKNEGIDKGHYEMILENKIGYQNIINILSL
ncbi:MAG: hypothetical protein WBO70_00235 [Erysipelotrichaceae bacterium]